MLIISMAFLMISKAGLILLLFFLGFGKIQITYCRNESNDYCNYGDEKTGTVSYILIEHNFKFYAI